MTIRIRRSVLYMPASNARALEKASTIDADALILDLEDAVAPESKDAARAQAVAALRSGRYGKRTVAVRINGLETEWGGADLAEATAARADAVVVPKVRSARDLEPVQAAVADAGGRTEIWAMMETPQAILNAAEIAAASRAMPTFTTFVIGTNDLAREMRVALEPGRAAFMPWLMQCIAAARAFGLDVIDGVWNALDDAEGFARACAEGRGLGMDGKSLIHPRQVEPCNRAFSPKPDEIAWAEAVVAAFARPENRNAGVIRLDGQMVERLHLSIAERILALAEAGGA